jgi:Protein of unknown function (DUF3224)
MQVDAPFEIDSWDEKPFDQGDGLAKLTHAVVAKTYSGDIDGTSVTHWVMAYAPDETAWFAGVERIRGTIGERTGTIVLQHVGSFSGGAATADLSVLSGTGDFDGATGTGDFRADPKGKISLTLD